MIMRLLSLHSLAGAIHHDSWIRHPTGQDYVNGTNSRTPPSLSCRPGRKRSTAHLSSVHQLAADRAKQKPRARNMRPVPWEDYPQQVMADSALKVQVSMHDACVLLSVSAPASNHSCMLPLADVPQSLPPASYHGNPARPTGQSACVTLEAGQAMCMAASAANELCSIRICCRHDMVPTGSHILRNSFSVAA